MSHVHHEGPEDAILFDGCPECDSRAAEPIAGLLRLDRANFAKLTGRVEEVEYGYRGAYLTGNEAALGRALYGIQILLEREGERHPGLRQR